MDLFTTNYNRLLRFADLQWRQVAIEEALIDPRLPLLHTQGLSPHHERARKHSSGYTQLKAEMRAGGRLEPLHHDGGPGHHLVI